MKQMMLNPKRALYLLNKLKLSPVFISLPPFLTLRFPPPIPWLSDSGDCFCPCLGATEPLCLGKAFGGPAPPPTAEHLRPLSWVWVDPNLDPLPLLPKTRWDRVRRDCLGWSRNGERAEVQPPVLDSGVRRPGVSFNHFTLDGSPSPGTALAGPCQNHLQRWAPQQSPADS